MSKHYIFYHCMINLYQGFDINMGSKFFRQWKNIFICKLLHLLIEASMLEYKKSIHIDSYINRKSLICSNFDIKLHFESAASIK